jgi:hypothetical protein
MTCQVEKSHPSHLRPKDFGNVLGLIKFVLDQDPENFQPLETLDVSQSILIFWGNVVPWSWTTWSDARIVNTECLRCLVILCPFYLVFYMLNFPKTATWLSHSNQRLPGIFNDTFLLETLRSSVLFDVAASSSMMLVRPPFTRHGHRNLDIIFSATAPKCRAKRDRYRGA